MSDDVSVIFGAKIDGLISGVEQVKSQLSTISGAAGSVTEAFTGIGEVVGTIFAVDKIDQFIEHIGDLGLQIERTGRQLGLTAEQVSVLNYAAQTNDVSTSQMRNSLERLTVGLDAATKGGNKQADALNLMGINAKQFIDNGGTMAELIELVAKKTAELAPTTNLASSFIGLMGRSGADAIPVFQDLGAHIDELREKVAAAGLAMNPAMVEAIAESRKANIDLKAATDGLGVSIFSIMKPAIDAAITGFRGFIQNLQDSTQYGGILWGLLEGLTGGFLALETAVIAVADIIKLVFQVLITGINTTLSAIQTTTTVMSDVIHGNFKRAADDIQAGNERTTKVWADGMSLISKNTQDTIDKLSKSWSDYFDDISSDSKKTNTELTSGGFAAGAKGPALPGSASNDAALRKKEMDEDIALEKSYLDLGIQNAGEDLAKKKQLYQDYFEWLKAKYPENTKAQNEALKQSQQITNQEVKQEEAIWQHYFNAFNSGLMGMLKGTMTWQQAASSIVWNLVEDWIKQAEKIAAHWVAQEIVKTTATQAQTVVRSTTVGTAEAADAAIKKAAAVSAITADSAVTFAGVFANLAPFMGPAAAGPAAAAQGTVLSEVSLASFAVGTWNVPHDMVAQLHGGERVMTAEENRSYSANGGGGGNMNVTIQAIDQKGVRDFFMNNSDMIAQSFKKANRGFNPNMSPSR